LRELLGSHLWIELGKTISYNLQQLRLFTTIVSCGSLGRAASALHLTQPALSRSLKRLEAQVGAPLFERHTKGMELTAIGDALLPHAMLLQHAAEQAREEIDAMRGLAKGTIKVGAVGSIASLILPLAVKHRYWRSIWWMPTWFAFAFLRRLATLEAAISLPTRVYPSSAG